MEISLYLKIKNRKVKGKFTLSCDLISLIRKWLTRENG